MNSVQGYLEILKVHTKDVDDEVMEPYGHPERTTE